MTDSLFICILAGTDRVELRLRGRLKPERSRGGNAPADQPAAGQLRGSWLPRRRPPMGARPPRTSRLRHRERRHQANSRNPPAQRPIGRQRTRRGDVSLIEHVPPDQVMGLAASPEIKVGQYPVRSSISWPWTAATRPCAAARCAAGYHTPGPQGASRGLLDQADGRGSGCGQRRAVSEGQLRRLSRREAARGGDVAGENAGGGCPQGNEQRPRIKLNFEYPSIPEVRR